METRVFALEKHSLSASSTVAKGKEKSLTRVMILALNFELFWQVPWHLSKCVFELSGLACIGA